MSFNCEPFYYQNLEGKSLERIVFISDQCIDSPFQYRVQLATLIIHVILFIINLLLLIHSMFHSKSSSSSSFCGGFFNLSPQNFKYGIPQKTLTLSLLTCVSLILYPLANFLNMTGFARVFCYGFLKSCLVGSVTFVLKNWFVVKANTSMMNNRERLSRYIEIITLVFNIVFHVIFWSFWTTASAFYDKDYKTYNLFMGLGMFWLGTCACAISFYVLYLGLTLVKRIKDSSIQSNSDVASTATRKILIYSGIQSFVWAFGGLAAVLLGAWSIWCFNTEEPMRYFFYMSYFWLLPAMAGANILVIFTTVKFKTKSRVSSKNHSSKSEGNSEMRDSKQRSSAILTTEKVEEFVEEMKKV